MRAAKGRSFAFFFAALFVSASAFASIPRITALDPPALDRFAESTGALPLHDQLARAASVSWPVESLPETRVGASLDFEPLFTEPTPLLTRALHQAYVELSATNASGRTLCGGDPVNCNDPEGLAGYFFDGTWNDKDGMVNVTNVAKLFNAYRGRRYYLPGVGTSKMLPAVDKYVGGGTGAGGTGKLEEMYWNLAKAFAAGDRQIDIFGFSRGAALAVAFANMIEERGIPDLSSKRTVRIATHNGVRSIEVYDRYFKAPKINFVGVFDIVGSFGLPGNKENIGFDLGRSKNTNAIRHATAMDENRFFFPLTSMLDAPGQGPANVKEVGFRGVHSDVGGGYEDIDDLAHAPLNWMWSEATAAGVPLNPLSARDRRINPNAPAHYSAGTGEELLDIMYRKLGWRYQRKIYYQGQ